MVVQSCTYHRNGCHGAGYFHVRFRIRADGRRYDATAIVFDAAEHVAIFAEGDDGRGAVSFRYEEYAPALRVFVASEKGQQMAFGPCITAA